MMVNGANDIDTMRLNGSFTQDLLEWKGASPAGVFQNISPGTFSDQVKGIFSFGAFTLSSKANGTSRLAVLTFKAKKAGDAYVQLTTNSRVLSAGEDQMGSVGRLNITIGETAVPQPEQPQPIPPVIQPGVAVFSVQSETHPDPNRWYSNRNVTTNWEIAGKKISHVYIGFDQSPEGPAELVTTSTKAQFTATSNGTWYVHVLAAFTDKSSQRADLQVLIDSTRPHPIYPVVDQTNINAKIVNFARYGTIDDSSGIGRYEVAVNGVLVTSTVLQAYLLNNQLPGDYVVTVKAFDLAGNSVEGHTNFLITSEVGPAVQDAYLLDLLKLMLFIIFVIMVMIFIFAWDRKRKDESRRNKSVIHRRK
jgi:hypothetical protein